MIKTEIINVILKVINSISRCFTFLYKYRTIYKLTGIFATRKFSRAQKNHRYAVLVAARNEETVIGKLIESISLQDYPAELVKIFVVADNCTDNTATVARNAGAICYERFNDEKRTKGFALQYLVECIAKDYGIEAYEGYFIFDADNLLKRDYISRMNDAFDAGEKIVTSYRNTKNFDDNWISASYAIHWLRTIRNEHRARSLFRLATRIQGTGFLFSNELIKNGWNYTGLTEDRAFCADAVAQGYKISYNNEAEFYDEQPVDIKTAMRQRIRWAKGHLQAFTETGGKLFIHIFKTNGAANAFASDDLPWYSRFFNNIRLRFMSFDMLTVVFPRSLTLALKKFVVFLFRVILIFSTGRIFGIGFAPKFLQWILSLLKIEITASSDFEALVWLTAFTFAWTINTYLKGILTAAYVYFMERRRIKRIKWYRKLWFCITFPIFDILGKISLVIALFIRVEWKPIPHTAAVGINAIK